MPRRCVGVGKGCIKAIIGSATPLSPEMIVTFAARQASEGTLTVLGDAMPTRYRHLHAIHRLFRGDLRPRSPWLDTCLCDRAADEAQFRLAEECACPHHDRASTEIPTLSPNQDTIAASKRHARMSFALQRCRHGPAQRLVREVQEQLPSIAGRLSTGAVHKRLEGRTSVIAERLPCDKSPVVPSGSGPAASVHHCAMRLSNSSTERHARTCDA